eukprot:3459165-Amphidinium_carterae.1
MPFQGPKGLRVLMGSTNQRQTSPQTRARAIDRQIVPQVPKNIWISLSNQRSPLQSFGLHSDAALFSKRSSGSPAGTASDVYPWQET